MPPADGDTRVGLPPSAFSDAFPFHVAFGPDLAVIQVGRTLARLLPDLRRGEALTDHFALARPFVPLTFDSLSEHPTTTVVLRSTRGRLRLKGQMLRHPDEPCMIFLCTPAASDIASISSLGLQVDDFAAHDSTIDFLLALQSAQATLADLQKTTDLLKLERTQLQRARDEAEQANRTKSEFLARMSHEIRTPLHAILGTTELALATPLTREQREYLQSVRAGSDALLFLINELLDFSKIEAGQMALDPTRFDLWQLVEGVADAASVQAVSKGLDVICWLDPSVPHDVIADGNRLRQVLVNLAGNAVKFTREGEVVIRVQVADDAPDGLGLHISVSDTGPGIPAEDQPRIFERFFQSRASSTSPMAGTGLGLSITKSLVELMGGHIAFESREGEGTRFDVTIPVQRATPERAPRARVLPQDPVLIVERPGATREMIQSHLAFSGCEVQVATGVAEALAALERRAYAAAIVNAGITTDDGTDLIRAIRARPEFDPTRLIVLGAVPSPQLVGSAVSSCLYLPIHADRLLDAVSLAAQGEGLADTADEVLTLPAITGSGRPPRVLVAEDNAENQRLARRILERAGAVVEIASDGEEAVQYAAHTRYDLVLMDLQMPRLDGFQATQAIRAAEDQRGEDQVPIVAFTAHAVDGFRERCLRVGMNDYLVKPIRTQELVDTVERWADRRVAVLVADDAPEILQIMRLRLRDTFRVVTAADGKAALEQFARQPISLVILDMQMPVLDGYATAAALRQQPDGRDVPIIALTSNDGSEPGTSAMAAGCTVHLVKPVRLATLFSTVEHLLEDAAHAPAASALDAPAAAADEPDPRSLVDPALADLVPGYVSDKRRQIPDMRRLLARQNLDQIRRLAHDLKGTGAAYGLPAVTDLGRDLERAARDADAGRCAILIEDLSRALDRAHARLGD